MEDSTWERDSPFWIRRPEKSFNYNWKSTDNKAYKLVPDKLGCFAYYDVNKPIF